MALEGDANTAKDNITPGFRRGLRADEDVSGQAPDVDKDASAAEKAAAGEDQGAPSPWANRTSSGGRGKDKSKKKRGIRALLPTGAIVGVFGLAGVGLGGLGVIAQPFAMLANLGEKFNTQDLGLDLRSRRIYKNMMGNTTKYGFLSEKYQRMSKKKIEGLQKQGIIVIDSATDKPCTARCKPSRLELHETMSGGGTKVTPVTADKFTATMMTNKNFRYGFTAGVRTKWASMNDGVARAVFKKIGISRNLFKTWNEDLKGLKVGNADKPSEKLLKQIVGDNTSLEVKNDVSNATDRTTTTDENGNKTTTVNADQSESGTSNTDSNKNTRLRAAGDFVMSKFGSVTTAGGNIFCALLTVGATISIIVGIAELHRMATYIGAFFEAVDKVKKGEGDGSPINEMMAQYNTAAVRMDATGQAITGATEDDNDFTYDYVDSGEPAKTAMQSSAMTWAMSNTAPDLTDPSIQKYSLENSINLFSGSVKAAANAISTCAITRIVAGIASIAITFIPIAGQAIKGGQVAAKAAISLSAKTLGKAFARGAVIATLITQGLTHLIPKIAEGLAVNYLEDALGTDLGSMTVASAHTAYDQIHQGGAGVAASGDKIVAYYQENQKLLADYAAIERRESSPFDVTSKYTFLGSIANSTLPYLSSMSSINGMFTTIGSLAGKSMSVFLPAASASALDEAVIRSSFGDCPALNDIGTEGDMHCVPWRTSPTAEVFVDIDSSDLYDKLEANHDIRFDPSSATGEVKIISKANGDLIDSSLSKFLIYCVNRESQLGISDPSLVAAQTMISTGNSTADAIIGAIPIVGDIIDIIEGVKGLDPSVENWANGQNCVDSDKNTETRGMLPWWQIFAEDERIIEQASDENYTPLVTAYIEDYEAQHPGYNSVITLLAQAAGVEESDMTEAILQLSSSSDTGELGPVVANNSPSPTAGLSYHKQTEGINLAASINLKSAVLGYLRPSNITL